jgi:hypothetical protein
MNRNKYYTPLLFVFSFVTAFVLAGRSFLDRNGIDHWVVLGGNFVLFAASLLSFWLMGRGIGGKNNYAFVRMVYAGFLGKFFICAVSAALYILLAGKVNKPAIYIILALYVIYTFLEVKGLMKLNRAQKNA